MIQAPYEKGKPHDDYLRQIFKREITRTAESEDDALYIITGMVGTGKSNLGLHAITVIDPEPKIENVPLTKEQFALAMLKVKDDYRNGKRPLYIQYDEAEANSRKAMSSWNNDMIRLYQTNRVFQCIHLWCNPNAKLLDKVFIEERVKGLFFTFTKEKNRPRRYLFFTKRRMLQMIDDNLKLSHFNLKKRAKKYANYLGWFRAYDGKLLEAYKKHKVESSSDIVDEFVKKYAGKSERQGVGAAQAARMLGVHPNTITKCIKQLAELEILDLDAVQTKVGRYKIPDAELKIIEAHLGGNHG